MESDTDTRARAYHHIYKGDHKAVLPDDLPADLKDAHPGWIAFRKVAGFVCRWQSENPSPPDTPQTLAVKLFGAGHPEMDLSAPFWTATKKSWERLAAALLPGNEGPG